jgi:hypothetical protein
MPVASGRQIAKPPTCENHNLYEKRTNPLARYLPCFLVASQVKFFFAPEKIYPDSNFSMPKVCRNSKHRRLPLQVSEKIKVNAIRTAE